MFKLFKRKKEVDLLPLFQEGLYLQHKDRLEEYTEFIKDIEKTHNKKIADKVNKLCMDYIDMEIEAINKEWEEGHKC